MAPLIHDMQLASRLGRHRVWLPGKWLWRSCSIWRLNSNKECRLELQGADANWGLLGSNGKAFTETSERWVCMPPRTSEALIAHCGSEQQVVDPSRGLAARYLWWRVQ